jgi:toxin ParE1/3/4
MANYSLAKKAAADFRAIARESLEKWGEARAERYLKEMFETAQRLADFPDLGREVSSIRPGLLRMTSASHVIFCQKQAGGILIIRILHERMDFLAHLQ